MKLELETTYTAEQAVIGAIILDEKALARVMNIITVEDFYFSVFRDCYRAILGLLNHGKPIDFVTVLGAMTEHSKDKHDEIKQLLIQCAETTPSISNVEQYAQIVMKSKKARRMQDVGTKLTLNQITAETVEQTANEVMSELFDISQNKHVKRLKNIGDVGVQVFENYCNNDRDLENRSHTGFPRLDAILKGMSAGNLVVLAARPKLGKTALALSIAENVAKSGKTVAFYSLEMENSEIYERLLSKRARIPMNTLIDKRFNDKTRPEKVRSEEINKISEAVDKIYSLPIRINDNPSCTANDIRLECRLVKNLGLIIIDYLQLMQGTKKYDTRNLEIGSICRNLKCLASELGVPVLCLSQLNRTSDECSRPSPSELRDSGSIEQDANKVVLMWCLEKNLDEQGFVKSKTIGIDVALNRRGTTGVTLFNFDGNYMSFTEFDRKYEEKKSRKAWR